MADGTSIEKFADYVTLVYHEARYLAELQTPEVKLLSDKLSRQKFPDRYTAWRALQPLRQQAKQCPTAKAIHAFFVERLGLPLERVAALFEDQRWKGRVVGGRR